MHWRLALLLVLLVCAGSAAAAVWPMSDESEPVPTSAPRTATVFVAADGDDGQSCRSPERACASFDRAYRQARPGEIVEVAGGEYPEQLITVDEDKTSSRHVTIRPARDARVTLAGLTLGSEAVGDGPRHLTIEDMRLAYKTPTQQVGASAKPGTTDVIWRNIDAGNFALWGVRDFRVEGGDYGPCAIALQGPCGHSIIDAGPPGYETENVVVDGALVHDYRFSPSCFEPGQDCHFECMYVNGSRDVTVSRTTFRDCALFDLFVTLSGPDAARVGHRNLKIVGNVFDTPWDENPENAQRARSSALSLGWCQNSPHGYQDVLVAFNSFQSGTGLPIEPIADCRLENVRVVGNLLAWDGCDSRFTYAYNVWSSTLRRGQCGRTDRIAGKTLPYKRGESGAKLDFRLRDGETPADALVPADAAPCPRRDIDGDARPRDGRCSAGADERAKRD